MPAFVAAVKATYAMFVAAGASGGLAAVMTTVVVAVSTPALFMYAALAASSSQKRKMRKAMAAMEQSGIDQGRQVMARDPVAPRQIVYGQVRKSGTITFMEVGGTNNEYLYVNVTIADHLCEELGQIYIDNEAVTLDGSGNVSSGKFSGFARVTKFLGLTAGERDTVLEGELPSSWTANHLGKEVARLHCRFKHSPDVFVNGLPLVEVMVKGKKLYDFRTATTVWSANSALCVADFLMDSRFGKGIAQARIISADVIEAANTCDENVTLNPSGTEDRYTTNGVVSTDSDPDSTLVELEAAMAGTVADPGGKWSIRAGAYRTPTISFTDADFADTSQFTMTPRQSRQDTFNGVRGQFIGPINNWAPADFPAVTNATYMGWDGGIRLWKDVVYNFTTSYATAQRLAKIDLEKGRQQIVVTADFKLKAMQCQPGDVIQLTRSSLGWSSKTFEVLDWSLKFAEAGGGPVLVCGMTLKEIASTCYNWASGEETVVDAAPNTNLWDAATVATPGTPTLSTSNFVQTDGTITPRLRVQWTAPSDEFVQVGGFITIEYKQAADSTWLVWSRLRGNATEDFITDVRANVSYNVRIKFENVRGVRGAYSSTATATVSNDVTAPSVPTSLAAVAQSDGIFLTWTNPTDDDLWGVEVFENTTNNSGTATSLGIHATASYFRGGLVAGSLRYYWLKAVDTTGNKSGFTSVASATAEASGSGSWTPVLTNITDLGSGSFRKTGGTGSWTDSELRSAEGFVGGAFMTFKAHQTNGDVIAGLNSDASSATNFASIDFGWYCFNGAVAQIYENNAFIGSYGAYTTSTVFSVIFDGTAVRYYMDGVLKYTSANVPSSTTPIYLDSSFNGVGHQIDAVHFGPMASATITYKLSLSALAVNKNTGGVFSPTTVTASATSKSGSNSPAAYAGRFKIYENGSGTASYTSSSDESSKVYTPSGTGVTSMKFELYLAGGTSTLLESITVPVTSDGTGSGTLGTASGDISGVGTTQTQLMSLTVTSDGALRNVLITGRWINSSGTAGTLSLHLWLDGSEITSWTSPSFTSGQNETFALNYAHTPSAASHTWAVKGNAQAGGTQITTSGGTLTIS